ncbi:unnamed protein product [Linum trigynum]|uniref:Transmembrane protein n=1 Tax=Linum trigynum TaxID=586398 RepID=A0AAV2EJJ4_9ROSI
MATIVAFASPFPPPCTSKLSHVAPNVPLGCQKTHIPFHKTNSSSPTRNLSSSFERSRIRVKIFSLSSSSKDDNNNSGTGSNNNKSVNDDVDGHMNSDVSSGDEFDLFEKQQAIHGFFKHLMTSLGDNVEFVVKPTLRHGINVGFTWKFQWSKTHFPLGEGLNLYILQTYQGKFFIRNLEMLVEVLPLNIEPIRLRFVAFVMGILNMMKGLNLYRYNMKRAMVYLLLMAIILLFLSSEIY